MRTIPLQNGLTSGFTLIELVIVMAIIGVIIIIAINAAQYNIAYSHDQEHKQEIVKLGQVLSDYFAEHNAYPLYCGRNGFDGGGSLDDLYSKISNTDSVYDDFTNIYTAITKEGFAGDIGYCSSFPASAYVLFVKTATPQYCKDARNPANNFYIIGDGTYVENGSYYNYYQLPEDGLDPLWQLTGPGYGEGCFRR